MGFEKGSAIRANGESSAGCSLWHHGGKRETFVQVILPKGCSSSRERWSGFAEAQRPEGERAGTRERSWSPVSDIGTFRTTPFSDKSPVSVAPLHSEESANVHSTGASKVLGEESNARLSTALILRFWYRHYMRLIIPHKTWNRPRRHQRSLALSSDPVDRSFFQSCGRVTTKLTLWPLTPTSSSNFWTPSRP